PNIDYIAKVIGVPKEEVVFALESIQDTVSLYEPIYNDGGDAIYVVDQVKDEKNLAENWLDSLALRESIKKLKGREKNIITLRFFKGKTQMEVADEIGISQAQVSRLEKNALDRIKRSIV
ncbi:MAG TPA: RNA polymerase sigma-G factor, partial [Clostridiales bacterium]|nr:RNA polymerase sigma-G factor [Clostridiales bacterium]